jgi:hypothetical protein
MNKQIAGEQGFRSNCSMPASQSLDADGGKKTIEPLIFKIFFGP